VKEAAFLMAMQRIVGGIEVEDDPLGRGLVGLEEQLDEQALNRFGIVVDLMVARDAEGRVLEPVERAFAGQRSAVLAPGGELASERRQHRVMAQLIVVDEVLIAERDAEDALRHHRPDAVLDLRPNPHVIEAGCEPFQQPDRPIGRAEQQRPGVRRDLATVKRRHHPAALDHFITEQVAATLCRHRGTPLRRPNCLWQKSYRRFGAPMHLLPVRNPG
jgi:hypothetical protein